MAEDEFDIAGAATGVVEAENLLGAERVKAGDLLLAMPSSGFHANGYSLIRHIVKAKNLQFDYFISEYQLTMGEVVLTPTEIYARDCLVLIKALGEKIRGFSHITGGGVAENTARVIPKGLTATYDRSTWQLPIAMEFFAKHGSVPQLDMERTWNCGVGMVAIIDPSVSELAIRSLAARGMKSWVAGEVKKSDANIGSSLINNYAK